MIWIIIIVVFILLLALIIATLWANRTSKDYDKQEGQIHCRNCNKKVYHYELRFSKNNKDKLILDCCVHCEEIGECVTTDVTK